jgi:hypothetical protein
MYCINGLQKNNNWQNYRVVSTLELFKISNIFWFIIFVHSKAKNIGGEDEDREYEKILN